MLRKLLFLLVLSLVLLLSFSTPVYAIGNPTSITIESVRIFQNLWVDGDQLYVVQFKVMYDPVPEERSGDTFLIGITPTTPMISKPLDYYLHNFTSIYLTPTQAIGWKGSYSIKVMGNPAYFTTLTEAVNMRTLALSDPYWISGSMADSREYLGAWCIQLAETFSSDAPVGWGIDLLTATGKLNTVGAVKFREAIPGLEGIVPDIFAVAVSYPEYTPEEHPKTYEEYLRTVGGERLETALNNLGTFLHIPGAIVGGLGLAILYFVLAGRIFTATGSVPAAVTVSLPFLFAGNLIGILPLYITFIAGLLVLVMFGVTFVLGRMG